MKYISYERGGLPMGKKRAQGVPDELRVLDRALRRRTRLGRARLWFREHMDAKRVAAMLSCNGGGIQASLEALPEAWTEEEVTPVVAPVRRPRRARDAAPIGRHRPRS
jgi:hypothetical protein